MKYLASIAAVLALAAIASAQSCYGTQTTCSGRAVKRATYMLVPVQAGCTGSKPQAVPPKSEPIPPPKAVPQAPATVNLVLVAHQGPLARWHERRAARLEARAQVHADIAATPRRIGFGLAAACASCGR